MKENSANTANETTNRRGRLGGNIDQWEWRSPNRHIESAGSAKRDCLDNVWGLTPQMGNAVELS